MNNKKIMIILTIFSVIFLSLGGTLAYWNWESENTLITFSVDEAFMCSADVGGDINLENVSLAPAECTSVKNAIKKRLMVYPIVLGDLTVGLDLWLEINSIAPELSATENFKYAVTKDESSCTNNVVTSGSFNGKQVGDTVELLKQQIYRESIYEGDEYWLYIWLDAAETSLNTANKSFNFSLNGTCKDHFEGYNFMVNFDVNGGLVDSTSKIVAVGDTYGTLPTPTKDGYAFLGWNTKADGTGENITSDSIVNLVSNTTLYAIWELSCYNGWQIGKTGTVEFTSNSNVNFANSKIRITYEEEYHQCNNVSKFHVTNMEIYHPSGSNPVMWTGGETALGDRGLLYTTSVNSTSTWIQKMSYSSGDTGFDSGDCRNWCGLYQSPADFPWSTGELSHNSTGELTLNLRLFVRTTTKNFSIMAEYDQTQSIVLTDLK